MLTQKTHPQKNINKDSEIPDILKKELRDFHLAIKTAFFYPKDHPAKKRAAKLMFESLQEILSSQEKHSFMIVGDEFQIHGLWGNSYSISDKTALELAKVFRRHSIRSITFSAGVELWELEKLLEILALKPSNGGRYDNIEHLISIDSFTNIEITGIDYDDIYFTDDNIDEGTLNDGKILMQYLTQGIGINADDALGYLLNLINKPEKMAYFINKTYESIDESGEVSLINSIKRMIDLGGRLTDKEKRELHKKILEFTMKIKSNLKKVLFSVSDVTQHLIEGLSIDDIVKLVISESIFNDEEDNNINMIPLQVMVKNMIIPHQNTNIVEYRKQINKVEEIIRARLSEIKGGKISDNEILAAIEQIFAKLGVEKLQILDEKSDSISNEFTLPEINEAQREIREKFISEIGYIKLAFLMMEIIGYEDDIDSYFFISQNLEDLAISFATQEYNNVDKESQCVNTFFEIINTFYRQASSRTNINFQKRAKEAIEKIIVEEIIERIINRLLDLENLEANLLEDFIKIIGDRATPYLVKALINSKNNEGYQRVITLINATNKNIISEIRKNLQDYQLATIIKNIIPILEETDDKEAGIFLLELLNHSDAQVCNYVLALLSKFSNKDIFNQLVSLKEINTENNDSLKTNLGNKITIRDYIIERIREILKTKDHHIKKIAIKALGNIGGEKAIPILLEILKKRWIIFNRQSIFELQIHSIEALSQIGTASANEIMVKMSKKRRGKLRIALENALQPHNNSIEENN